MAEALGWDVDVRVVSNYGTGGDAQNRGERTAAEPAATVTPKVDRNVVLRNGRAANATVRQMDEPAATVYCSRPGNLTWRLRNNNNNNNNNACVRDIDEPAGERQFGEQSVRVTVQEAGVLQGFRRDYPWQGTKTQQYLQVGNAICPPLAAAILRPLLAASATSEAAA
jgi:DNA (cytosine-5)-methyltransferase 1